jgi:hypothetical protein
MLSLYFEPILFFWVLRIHSSADMDITHFDIVLALSYQCLFLLNLFLEFLCYCYFPVNNFFEMVISDLFLCQLYVELSLLYEHLFVFEIVVS